MELQILTLYAFLGSSLTHVWVFLRGPLGGPREVLLGRFDTLYIALGTRLIPNGLRHKKNYAKACTKVKDTSTYQGTFFERHEHFTSKRSKTLQTEL